MVCAAARGWQADHCLEERARLCRDLSQAGLCRADDLAKQAGHANKRTTARVYDRDRLEAARRVAQARSLIAATQRVNGVSRNASRPKAKINGLKWFHIYRALTLRIA
jgi:hypothetical protein